MSQQTVLDSAGFVDIDEAKSPFLQSDPRSGIVVSHVRNGDIGSRTKRLFTLRWQPANRGTVLNIRDHYLANANTAFDLQLASGESVQVIYRAPPRIVGRTWLASDVTVQLEETMFSTVTAGESVMTDLPAFGAMTQVTTLNAGGHWQYGASVKDSFGDFRLGIVTVSGTKYYLIVWHWIGGVVARKSYGDPYTGWPTNIVANPTRAIPRVDGTPCSLNLDTWDWIQNPSTGLVTATSGNKPGVLPAGKTGYVWCIQRATATDPTEDPADWTHPSSEVLFEPHASAPWEGPDIEGTAYSGGVVEQSIVYLPETDEFVMFYCGRVTEASTPDFTGEALKWRIGRATCPAAIFDSAPVFTRNPAASASSWVWDPIENGAGPGLMYGNTNGSAVWGTAYVSLQPHVSYHDGILHMVLLQAKPNEDQGTQNDTWAIGHYWSDDLGFTWTGDVNNPLVTKDDLPFSVDPAVANFFNSPNLFWDDTAGKVYLAFASGPNGVYQVDTELLLMEAAI